MRNVGDVDTKQFIIWFLPSIFVLPATFQPIGLENHPAVEAAGYFQTVAIVETGIDSYAHLTIVESFSSLHLHSLLSSPLFAVGILHAGRIISLLAAVAAVILIHRIASREYEQAAILAPAMLWATPLFVRFSGRWYTQSLSIALTIGVVYAVLKHVDTGRRRWYFCSLLLLAGGITNHLWEASIALPVVAIYSYHRRLKEAAGAVATTLLTIVVVTAVKSFQPAVHNLTNSYAFYNHLELFADPSFLVRGGPFQKYAFHFTVAILPLIAVVLFLYFTTKFYRSRSRASILLASWLLSGLSIIFLLPRGWVSHDYYAWGLLAPLSLSAVHIASKLRSRSILRKEHVSMLCVTLLVFASAYALWFSIGPPVLNRTADPATQTIENNELLRAGQQLRHATVESHEIAFVGNWSGEHVAKWRILMYARISPPGYRIKDSHPGSPSVVDSVAEATHCQWMVIQEGDTVRTRPCD